MSAVTTPMHDTDPQTDPTPPTPAPESMTEDAVAAALAAWRRERDTQHAAQTPVETVVKRSRLEPDAAAPVDGDDAEPARMPSPAVAAPDGPADSGARRPRVFVVAKPVAAEPVPEASAAPRDPAAAEDGARRGPRRRRHPDRAPVLISHQVLIAPEPEPEPTPQTPAGDTEYDRVRAAMDKLREELAASEAARDTAHRVLAGLDELLAGHRPTGRRGKR